MDAEWSQMVPSSLHHTCTGTNKNVVHTRVQLVLSAMPKAPQRLFQTESGWFLAPDVCREQVLELQGGGRSIPYFPGWYISILSLEWLRHARAVTDSIEVFPPFFPAGSHYLLGIWAQCHLLKSINRLTQGNWALVWSLTLSQSPIHLNCDHF